jgi:hypothetical protein
MSNISPDYFITHVRYDREEKHIDMVITRRVIGDRNLDSPEENTRESIVRMRKNDKTVVTAIAEEGENDTFYPGAVVDIIRVNGREYLRTDSNKIARDNLENLPRF